MRYLIIGLGIYGTNLAIDLTDLGHEVVGADIRSQSVEAVKDRIATAYVLDATDEQALSVLPLKNVDRIVVAIGENFGASVKCVALLRKMGAHDIYARAIDAVHESILQGLNVDRILTPEQRAAKDLAYEMELGAHVDALAIDSDRYVLRFKVPRYFVGMKYTDLTIDRTFGLHVIAATRRSEQCNVLGIRHKCDVPLDLHDFDLHVEPDDIITVIGTSQAYREMVRLIR